MREDRMPRHHTCVEELSLLVLLIGLGPLVHYTCYGISAKT